MRVRFISKNKHKIAEAVAILAPGGVDVVPIHITIEELQIADAVAIVRDKAIKAFHRVGHPLFVEQTGLFIEALNGFPGGLTQVFWDTLEADRVSALFGQGNKTRVTAKTIIGYCDGKIVRHFSGEIEGRIAEKPRGDRAFQWDCVFIPVGHSQTFAEMGEQKNTISMRKLALDEFAKYLGSVRRA